MSRLLRCLKFNIDVFVGVEGTLNLGSRRLGEMKRSQT